MITYDEISRFLPEYGLNIAGAFQCDADDGLPVTTLCMLSPAPSFWEHFSASPEFEDGTVDPIDRWSERVIDAIALELDAVAFYPFSGPPYFPFQRWAQKTKRSWQSEVGLLVHDTSGLMISFRGALGFHHPLDIPSTTCGNPCDKCVGKPCRTACPVGALTPKGYNAESCKSHLRSDAGNDCMTSGCIVRRACPWSSGAKRVAEQSAMHMQAFRGE